jgi:CheY-like chemotaxis protein/HPt (histidine-containing phosphotransfer) domain-containing protein
MNTKRAPRILVVDDDVVSREVICLLLKGEGYEVESVESGDAALLRLETRTGSLPEIVLTDLQMPGVAGIELAGRLRGLCEAATALLAMSGSLPEEKTKKAFDGFLMKPFTMAAFAAAIAGCSAAVAGGEVPEKDAALDVVLNEAVYARFAASMRREKMDQLYALCLEDAERRAGRMRQAAGDGDDAMYRREAHAIKGGCGMVGAAELQKLATSMEERGLSDTNYLASLDEFTLAWKRLHRMLVAHTGT